MALASGRVALCVAIGLCMVLGGVLLAKRAAPPVRFTARGTKPDPPLPTATKRVVAFSLYGSNPRYTSGAAENARRAAVFFPGWIARFYYDNSVPVPIVAELRAANNVELVNMTDSANVYANKRMWRFLVATDTTVARYTVRDIDSRLSARDRDAVALWELSGKSFHTMRDHPSHCSSSMAMLGGMWGGTKLLPALSRGIQTTTSGFYDDQLLLHQVVWPFVQSDCLQIASFCCNLFGSSVPFPTPRHGLEFVGAVYNGDCNRFPGLPWIFTTRCKGPSPSHQVALARALPINKCEPIV